MRLTPPKQIVWLVSLILGILGIVLTLVEGQYTAYGVWALAIGWLLLILGTLLKGF